MVVLFLCPLGIAGATAVWGLMAMWHRRWPQAIAAGAACLACAGVASYVIVQHGNVLRRANQMHAVSEPRRNLNDVTTAKDDVLFGEQVTAASGSFTLVSVDLRRAHLMLFWKRPDGSRFGSFNALSENLREDGQRLAFAVNAGIFDPGFTPCGLHVEAGHERVPLNLATGEGNFYMKPNGVFLLDDAGARIVDSTKYGGTNSAVRLATQSGPLLVIDGQINPALTPHSTNRRVRSGVGVSSAQQVHFVISDQPVTFYELAALFRERLGCRDALYLDGVISRFYLPPQRIEASPDDFAGILGVTTRP